jgi:sulfonate transport system permease protein
MAVVSSSGPVPAAAVPAVHQDEIPNVLDIARAFKGMANYWRGGLGAADTSQGGTATLWGAVLGLGYNSLITGYRLAAGVALGIAVGGGLAVALSWSSVLRRMFLFPASLARMLPMLALIPLFLLWFAGTNRGAILFIGFSVFVMIFVVVLNAIENVEPHRAMWAATLGAGRVRTYLTVIVPAALPEIRIGVLMAFGLSWTTAVGAEYLGQQYGLGHIAELADYFGRTNTLALIAFVLVIYAALSIALVSRGLRWALRWAE